MANLLPRLPNILTTFLESESSLNKLFTVFDEEVPDGFVTDGSDFDEFCESVSDL
jgi:hypothetical protein